MLGTGLDARDTALTQSGNISALMELILVRGYIR